MCPFENCSHVSKLSLIKQNDLFALPKFNRYNFERHFTGQHLVKKRKPFDDVSNRICEAPEKSRKTSTVVFDSDGTQQIQQIYVAQTKIGSQYNLDDEILSQENSGNLDDEILSQILAQKEKIDKLEAENSVLRQQQQHKSSTQNLGLEDENSSHEIEIQTLKNRNEILQQQLITQHHKYMDLRGTIRTVCRIKPDNGQPCYLWDINDDKNVLQLCKEYV